MSKHSLAKRLKIYNLSEDQYNQLYRQQNGLCKICFLPESRKSRLGNVCSLMIDHCHKTGQVRGLLCHKCNTGLGSFKDDIKLLQAAIRYLDR